MEVTCLYCSQSFDCHPKKVRKSTDDIYYTICPSCGEDCFLDPFDLEEELSETELEYVADNNSDFEEKDEDEEEEDESF